MHVAARRSEARLIFGQRIVSKERTVSTCPFGMASAVLVPVAAMITDEPGVSVVISTYNRGRMLPAALQSVRDQRGPLADTLELIVVDNNSTDDTREVIRQIAAVDPRVRYVFEPRQGSSHGRNAGIRECRAAIVAFTDDDVRVEPGWIDAIVRAFREHPHAGVVGGRVLPLWPSPPPAWLTPEHWPPLALIDYGGVPMVVSPERPICLVTANAAFRRNVLAEVGGFSPAVQLGSHGVLGSVEDHELQLRVLAAGVSMVYDPRIVVHAEVQPNRLDRAYHRRWHAGHGHFHAMMRSKEMEGTRTGTLFGVPAHMYRQALVDVVGWTRAKAGGDREAAFRHELRLNFFGGFFRTRRREFLERPRPERRGELWRLIRGRGPLAPRAGVR
jgi:glycosyltransferase involved in cell wall biosynthesis